MPAFLASSNAAYTRINTHTHNDSIRRNATHCISPKITAYYDDLAINRFERGFNEGNAFNMGYIHLFLDIHA